MISWLDVLAQHNEKHVKWNQELMIDSQVTSQLWENIFFCSKSEKEMSSYMTEENMLTWKEVTLTKHYWATDKCPFKAWYVDVMFLVI